MLILGIETACDDCSASVVEDGLTVRSSIVLGQVDVHQRFGGVVPELAARRHVEVVTRVVDEALITSGVALCDIDAIAVNNKHGLLRSVVVGVSAAKGLAIAASKPLIGVHHIEGHIYSALLSADTVIFPHVCLAVAGGHNLLLLVEDIGKYRILGRSLDDAAGEAFDKVAIELGLGLPGGPAVSKLAQLGDPTAYQFPRPMLQKVGLDFSFSGLKTAVRRQIEKAGSDIEKVSADVAASFEAAVVEVLITKLVRAAKFEKVRQITIVGGVAANSKLRSGIKIAAQQQGLFATFAKPEFCTDNAAMIAGLAFHHFEAGEFSDLSLEAYPNAPLGEYQSKYK
jgi:tRNA N6-adenosine threonylcarbamoyltransferase